MVAAIILLKAALHQGNYWEHVACYSLLEFCQLLKNQLVRLPICCQLLLWYKAALVPLTTEFSLYTSASTVLRTSYFCFYLRRTLQTIS